MSLAISYLAKKVWSLISSQLAMFLMLLLHRQKKKSDSKKRKERFLEHFKWRSSRMSIDFQCETAAVRKLVRKYTVLINGSDKESSTETYRGLQFKTNAFEHIKALHRACVFLLRDHERYQFWSWQNKYRKINYMFYHKTINIVLDIFRTRIISWHI